MVKTLLVWGSWLGAAYLLGSVPFGYLIGRMRGIDVRTVGSKNIGATNVFRTVGKKWGLLAFACDFLKGFAPTVLACSQYGRADALPVFVGLTCVLGHTFTVFMKFKGGKGVATAFGMLVALAPLLVGIAFAAFVVTVWLSHYISLGSILAASIVAVGVWLMPASLALRLVCTLVGTFVIVKHRSNIVRLLHGVENKIY